MKNSTHNPYSQTRTIDEKDFRQLLKIVKAAQEACDWCYVHTNVTAVRKMRSLQKAIDKFNN